MADFTPTYYEPANKEEAEKIARANQETIAEVKRLIRAGAMVNHQRSDNGHTPLHVAVQLASPELVRILLDAGARRDIRGETARGPMTPLEYADFLEEKVPGYAFEEGRQLLRAAEPGVSGYGAGALERDMATSGWSSFLEPET